MRIEKCENGLAVQLSPALVEALALKEGDEVEINLQRQPGREELLQRLYAFHAQPAEIGPERRTANAR